jgi:hypothetical protein
LWRWSLAAVVLAAVCAVALTQQGSRLGDTAVAVPVVCGAVLSVAALRPVAARKLGRWTGAAALIAGGGTVMAVVAVALADCPGTDGGRCDAAETGSWWLNGALLVVSVLLVQSAAGLAMAGLRRLRRRVGGLGRWAGRQARDVVEDVATRSDGLFIRPPWRDPLVGTGLAGAVAAASAWRLYDDNGVAVLMAAVAGFVIAGVLPAAWRLPRRRPDVVAANRRRARAPRRRAGRKGR